MRSATTVRRLISYYTHGGVSSVTSGSAAVSLQAHGSRLNGVILFAAGATDLWSY